MTAAYRIRITPADVGSRVSVRLRIHAPAGEPSATDVVGRLRAWDGGTLMIERRDGSVAEVAADDLLAAKVIGETPLRRPGGPAPSGT
ncbi:MAG: hypothetical protein M3415_07615 [Actinomycetota bacterium]|nr:hypothetical protein [Actinomycetota bacterium]